MLGGSRRIALIISMIVLAIVIGLVITPSAFATNPDPVQYFYVPFTESQLLSAYQAISTDAVSPITSYIGITAIASGTLIYYDQWENGYDVDIANPTSIYNASTNPAGTQIWGDGNPANGAPPGVPSDIIAAGTVIILRNDVPSTRTKNDIYFDGGDKIAATKTIAVTRCSWAGTSSTMMAGAVTLYDLYQWGTDYRVPVGTNIPDTTDYQMFEYTACSVMAGPDGATIHIDSNNDGTAEVNATLTEGQTYYVTGLYAGAHIWSDDYPIQVDIFTGDVGSTYECRDSPLTPTGTWSSDYVTPVSTASSAQGLSGSDTTVWLFNAGTSSITVTYRRWVAGTMTTSTIAVGAGSYAKQLLADGTGSEFYTANGAPFYAFSTTDSNDSTNGSGYNTTGNQAWDWGFSLLPKGKLSTEALVGLGLGRDPNSTTNLSEDGSPVWVTPMVGDTTTAVTVYVDYDGDPSTGALVDPNGNHYDTSVSLHELERAKIVEPVLTHDATSSASNSSLTTSQLSWYHTTGTGANRLMLVGVAINNDTTEATVSSVTYGGAVLTYVGSVESAAGTGGAKARTEVWAMANPPSGMAQVQVTLSTGRIFSAGASTFSGVDLSGGLASALGTYYSNSAASGRAASVNVTTTPGDWVYDVVDLATISGTNPGAITPGSWQTQRWTQSYRSGNYRARAAASTGLATTTSLAVTETSTNSNAWALSAVQINAISPDAQSGMLLYTLNPNYKLSVAWGEDPNLATAGEPGLDAGTSVPPIPEISANKTGGLYVDNDGDGYISPGDVLQYSIVTDDVSRIAVPDVRVYDVIPTGTAYVPNSTYVGTTLISDDTSGTTAFPLDNGSGTTAGYDIGTLQAAGHTGDSQTVTFQVTIGSYPVGGTGLTRIDNVGQASALNSIIPVKDRSYLRGWLGDLVWFDWDGDGVQDGGANETGIQGITVTLYDSTGTNVITDNNGNAITAVTDANGNYTFKGLYPGTYVVKFGPVPSADNLAFSAANQGGNTALDSDVTSVSTDGTTGAITGSTSAFSLGGGQHKTDIDAGLYQKTNTRIVVGTFGANVQDGKVVITWTTLSEIGTAGYYLERETGGGNWVQVNSRMVPALLESPTGGTYSVVDSDAEIGQTYIYRLVEVETTGLRRHYGPWRVTATESMPAGTAANAIAAGDDTVRLPKTPKRTSMWVPPVTSTPALTKTAASPDRLKIEITKEGLYRIDASDLVSGLGLTTSRARELIRTKGVKLTTMGQNVAYLGVADGSALYFYGQAIDSIYTSTNVYWLTVAGGTPMAAAPPVTSGGTPATMFVDTQHYEQNLMDLPALFDDPEADFWLWDSLFADDPPTKEKIDVPDAVPAASGQTLKISLKGESTDGVANEDHLQVSLNNTPLGVAYWSGMAPYQASFAIPPGVLQTGSNEVELQALGDVDPNSMFGLDSMDLTYTRLTNAVDDQLQLLAQATAPMQVGALSTASNAWVFDITNPTTPALVQGTGAGGAPGAAWVSFVTTAGDKYLVATADKALRPQAITGTSVSLATESLSLYLPGAFLLGDQGADYVVITTDALRDAASDLAAYRASQGLKTKVVTVTQIYDAFNYGIASPHAIQSFIDYATTHWPRPPQYVVLAGQGSYDYKNYAHQEDSMVPPLMADSGAGLAVSDVLLACGSSPDGAPRVAIGRLPARTPADLENAIAKIEAYEAAPGGTWQDTVLFTADNRDEGGDFPTDSDRLLTHVPEGLQVHKAYLDDTSLALARALLFPSFGGNTLLINFVGHGAPLQLASLGNSPLLADSDVNTLPAASSLPILTAFTCLAGDFGVPGQDSLGQLLTERAGAGAIAVWMPSASEDDGESVTLGTVFMGNLFDISRSSMLGQAVQRSFREAAGAGVSVGTLRTYNLLGDPALRVRF